MDGYCYACDPSPDGSGCCLKNQACPGSSGCFPSASKVKIENGKLVAMSELQKGDKVQTGTDSENFYHIHLFIYFIAFIILFYSLF